MSATEQGVVTPPACECGECFFPGIINIGGKWVCIHHAPAEASYYKKYGEPYRAAPRKESTHER